MPYLEVKKSEETESSTIQMPNVVGLTLAEAKEILSDFEIQVETENTTSSSIISKQIPEEGVSINIGSTIILYFK